MLLIQRLYLRLCIFSSLLVFSGSAYSNANTHNELDLFSLSLEELSNLKVVTAVTGYKQSIADAPSSVTVMSAKEWEVLGASTLEEALRGTPGVHIGRHSFNQGNTSINIRGISGFQGRNIKVLVNGFSIEESQLGGRNGQLSPLIGNIKRVEVVKGPGSVLFGADAFAGVVNLVLPEAGDEHFNRAILRAGDDDHIDFVLANGGNSGDHRWFIGLDYSSAGANSGRLINQDLQSTFDRRFGTSASNAPGRLTEEHDKLNFTVQYKWGELDLNYINFRTRGSAGIGAANALDKRGTSTNHNERFQAKYNISHLIDYFPGDVSVSAAVINRYIENRWDVFPPHSLFPVGDDGNLFTPGGGLVIFPDGVRGTPGANMREYEFKLTHLMARGSHDIRTEMGYYIEKQDAFESKNFGPGVLNNLTFPVNGTPYISDKMIDVSNTDYLYMKPHISRYFNWFSVQDVWKLSDKFVASLGFRFDHYSDFGDTSNPRLGINWHINKKLKLRAFYGSAFRAPKQGELAIQNNPSLLGNSELQPESIDTYELGFTHQVTPNLIIEGVAYQFYASDLINEIPLNDGTGLSKYQNVGKVDGEGFEFIFKWKPSTNVTIDSHATFNRLSSAGEKSSQDYPETMYYFAANWNITDKTTFNMSAKYVGERTRLVSDLRSPLQSYTWVTGQLTWNINHKLTATFLMQNLTDADAREPSLYLSGIPDDLPHPGRHSKIEFRFTY